MREQEEKLVVRSAGNSAIRSAMRVGVVLATTISLGSGPSAQESGGAAPSIGPSTGPSAGPKGLPTPNYPSSPHRGVIDGWTGKPIPCRCRFEGKQLELGTIVCMSTHLGTVLTRCDLVGNNTSWMPSREPCTPKAGS